jgi:exopolysaccharide transport family protein
MFTDGPIDTAQLDSQLQILQSKAIASFVLDDLKLMHDPEFAASNGGSIRDIFEKPNLDPREAAIAAFADRLTAGRVGNSYVIEISFSSHNPDRAAQIANAVANAYIVDQVEAKLQVNRTAGTWLQERLQQLSVQSTAAERAVLEFRQQNNIVEAQGKMMDEQQVADLNSRLVAARAQTSDLFARLSRIETVVHMGTSNANFDATVSDVLTSPILTNLRQQYLDLARREAEWSSLYGRNHTAVVNLRNRLRDIRSSTFEELQRLAETTKSDYEIAKQRQEEIEKQLAQAVSESRITDKAQVALRELESTAKGYRNLYETFLQRHMASIQQDSFPIAEARLISTASTPTSKSKPKTPLVLALALMGGIGLGIGAGLFRELRDRVFRTAGQLQAVLQIPCLALVPLLKGKEPNKLPLKQAPSDKTFGQRTIAHDSSAYWKVVNSPLSSFAESIRSIKLAINLNVTSRPNKVIGFTSSLPNEGKSTIAAALAQLIAQVGGRVILVDCDLRNPSLSRGLAPEATIGLMDVISGVKSLEEAVWRDPTTNLTFLPSVKKTPLFHASELFAAESTKKLFDMLRGSFDYVVVDLPPLAPVVDVRAITHVLDCMILVVEWGQTKIDVVQQALDTAPNVYEALIGAVLNKTDMDYIGRYDASGSDLYRNKYYTRYG